MKLKVRKRAAGGSSPLSLRIILHQSSFIGRSFYVYSKKQFCWCRDSAAGLHTSKEFQHLHTGGYSRLYPQAAVQCSYSLTLNRKTVEGVHFHECNRVLHLFSCLRPMTPKQLKKVSVYFPDTIFIFHIQCMIYHFISHSLITAGVNTHYFSFAPGWFYVAGSCTFI